MLLLNPFLKVGVISISYVLMAAVGYLYYSGSIYALPFLLVATSALFPLWIWKDLPAKGIPYMLIFVLLMGLFFLMPLFISNAALLRFSPELIPKAAISISLYFVAIGVGWKSGMAKATLSPARWKILGEKSEDTAKLAMRIAFFLLCVGIAGQLTPFFLNLGALWSVLRAGTSAAGALGILLGAYADGISSKFTPKFWILLAVMFFLSIYDILISAAVQIMLAALLGSALGTKKIPWKLLIVIVSVVSFLSLGKFIMRERYWGNRGANNTGVTLMGLPGLYAEWVGASLDAMSGNVDQDRQMAKLQRKQEGAGGGEGVFGERINSFENVLFITQQLEEAQLPLLNGATYTLIPPLLIPRFFWPDKPRAHAGQDLLNIHFERQRPEDVDRTFIAWGFLPEGIGNFGLWLGPLIVGYVVGFVTGWLEKWSIRKEFFSVEGFLAIGLLLQDLIAYEMVASLFITSTFQMIVVCLGGGFMLRTMFARGGAEKKIGAGMPGAVQV